MDSFMFQQWDDKVGPFGRIFWGSKQTGTIVARDRFLLNCLQLIATLQSYASQETPQSLAIGWDWGAKPTDSFNATIRKIDEIYYLPSPN